MIRFALRACLLGAAAILAGPLAAAPLTLTCPEKPETAAGSGWTKLAATPAGSSDGWSIFDGRPEEMAQLAPDRDTGKAQVFGFDPKAETWIRCGSGSPVAVYERKLPAGLKACEVRYGGPKTKPKFERTLACR